MPPEGRFTTPTPQNAVFSDDFNDRIITNPTFVREALIEVDLISASLSFTWRGRIFVTAARNPRLAFLHTGTH